MKGVFLKELYRKLVGMAPNEGVAFHALRVALTPGHLGTVTSSLCRSVIVASSAGLKV